MELKKQVCNLDLAKKLKELGVEQDGIYTWVYDELNKRWDISILCYEAFKLAHPDKKAYSAFTVAELIEGLPKKIGGINGHHLILSLDGLFNPTVWYGKSIGKGGMQELYLEHGENISDALAKMKIYLIENKLI